MNYVIGFLSQHNKHSRKNFSVHGFLSFTVLEDLQYVAKFHVSIAEEESNVSLHWSEMISLQVFTQIPRQVSGQDQKFPSATGTNQIAGFEEFCLLTH